MSAYWRQKRPFSVTLTLWSVFLFGVWNIGRVAALGQEIQLFLDLEIRPDPRLRLLLALVWAILFSIVWLGLRGRRPFTRTAVPVLLLLYAISELSFQLFFAQAPAARQSGGINALFYILMILFTGWALNRTAAKPYFNL